MIVLFALKLLLTPTLIGLLSLAGRRWGPAVSGLLVGLPLTSGPIALFLALDQGTGFAARAAQGTLLGQISVASFCLAYSWLALRLGWLYSVLISWGVFFAATFVLENVSVPPLVVSFVGVVAFLAIVLNLLPRIRQKVIVANPPHWETLLRMLVATVFVLVLTGLASSLGPQLSGLLAPFPMYGSILTVFTHRFQGANAARQLLHGLVVGSFTFAVFFLVVAGLIESQGIAIAFGLATLVALLMHGSLLWFLRRSFV
jgi:hypothetical protein